MHFYQKLRFNMKSKMHFIKMLLHLLALYATFQGCYSDADQLTAAKIPTPCNPSSTILFRAIGNIYPVGYHYVKVELGDPPLQYLFDFDTGSHFTWVQCDAPCQNCLPAPNPPYKPVTRNLVGCTSPICDEIRYPKDHQCESINEPCTYYIRYADGGSSLGVVINDPFPLRYTNGTLIRPHVSFGYGYHQKHPNPETRPHVDGIFGLGSGKEGILSQLRELGLIKSVVGHCFSKQGDGYLFLGDDFVPSNAVWTPMIHTNEFARYYLGVAELYVGRYTTGIRNLRVLFDNAATHTYFASQAYATLVSMIKKDANEKKLEEVFDEHLPLCWKGPHPFESIEEVIHKFRPITLSFFENPRNALFEMGPEAYLIVNKDGHVCLGILDSVINNAPTVTLIGAVSFQDKLIIYDNENQRIGWTTANCNDYPCHPITKN